MNEDLIEELGITPILPMLDRIAAISSHEELTTTMASMRRDGPRWSIQHVRVNRRQKPRNLRIAYESVRFRFYQTVTTISVTVKISKTSVLSISST